MKNGKRRVILWFVALVAICAALMLVPAVRRAVASLLPGGLGGSEVRFYGKVVDQNGNPVEGATITVVIGIEHLLDGEERKLKCKTDVNGQFKIEGEAGDSMTIEKAAKAGFAEHIAPDTFGGFLGEGSFQFDPKSPHRFHPDPKLPVVLHMWRMGKTEPLIRRDVNGWTGGKGQISTVDFLKGKMHLNDALAEGDIRVSVQRGPSNGFNKPFDWTLTVEAVDGGCIETHDLFPYEAPAAGYQPTYQLVEKATDPHWTGRTSRTLYVRSRGGRVYARAYVEVTLPSDERAHVGVVYEANPAGSRNLEMDDSKVIH